MSFSLILTNCLFCGLAALLLIPLLRHPDSLVYKSGIPIFFIASIIFIKLLFPCEFTFTHTLASRNILPIVNGIVQYHILRKISIGDLLIVAWLFVSGGMLCQVIVKHQKLMKILGLVPLNRNQEVKYIVETLCNQKNISKRPDIIQLDMDKGPFITGFLKPIIVLPNNISNEEATYIIHHELEHLANRHIWIKACTEVVFIAYWWNPIVWILRNEIIRSLELQADAKVMKQLSDECSFIYLETLIKISRQIQEKRASNLALSFTIKNSMIEYRVRSALNRNSCLNKRKRYYAGLLILSIVVVLTSFVYTFESYVVNTSDIQGSFSINPKTDYFILRKDNFYDLYVTGKRIGTFQVIPEELSELTIR